MPDVVLLNPLTTLSQTEDDLTQHFSKMNRHSVNHSPDIFHMGNITHMFHELRKTTFQDRSSAFIHFIKYLDQEGSGILQADLTTLLRCQN